MQSNTILINHTSYEVRAAVLSQGAISEFFVEHPHKCTAVGNIYKGKVVKILPGMQSAFVDIGLFKAAFLHIADIKKPRPEDEFCGSEEDIHDDECEKEFASPDLPIEEILTEGQEIVVQVAKDATGNKGARLTMHLSVSGRYLVLMPGYKHIGISRKIGDSEEREKLKKLLKAILPPEGGLIARTVSKGRSENDLTADRDYLLRIWKRIQLNCESAAAPALVYKDDNLIFRILRDVVGYDTDEILIDDTAAYTNLTIFCNEYLPALTDKLKLYTKHTPIFEAYNAEIEVNRLLDKKVWLRSGGYIVIEHTEALTVIDVNTGKFVGKRNFEETIFKTNIEAAREITHQIKLRNLGGIIIVDFIDMETEENRAKVLNLLNELLREDRAHASVVSITALGLVEITRKRAQESLIRLMSEPCPYCEGKGVVKSRMTICYDILRHIRRTAKEYKGKNLILETHSEVADILLSNAREYLSDLESLFNIKIEMKFASHFHIEHYEITPVLGYSGS
ncbi:MAG: Rne/Rng family ribonuclease [Deferribacteraceae bacterium]|jgi:ribonuclease G|nr:Rne/Rng family ribonuclease [Deferribacteraceae bacterium]